MEFIVCKRDKPLSVHPPSRYMYMCTDYCHHTIVWKISASRFRFRYKDGNLGLFILLTAALMKSLSWGKMRGQSRASCSYDVQTPPDIYMLLYPRESLPLCYIVTTPEVKQHPMSGDRGFRRYVYIPPQFSVVLGAGQSQVLLSGTFFDCFSVRGCLK